MSPRFAALRDALQAAVQIGTTVATILATSGCSSMGASSVTQGIDSWKGRPVAAVVNAWGLPDATIDHEGKKLYVWSKTTAPGALPTYDNDGTMRVLQTSADKCKVTLQVDSKSNTVIATAIDGSVSGCKLFPASI